MVRFSRVDAVTRTERGIRAELHGETLEVDVVRDDVVRLRISRGGAFDDHPTFAVCVDPLSTPVAFQVEHDDGAVRVRTCALVVTVELDPFCLDVHRADGTPVVEGLRDDEGRCWSFATLNDAFEVRRRCTPGDPIWGLGEKTGRHNRRGRAFTLWNTDVLDPRASGEFAATVTAGDPRADNTSTQFDPYYMSIPLFHHQAQPGGPIGASFVDNGYRAHLDFTAPHEYRFGFDGGQYTEYVFAGPDLRSILAAYTWLTGRTPLPPLWALGFHQCRWFPYTQDALEAIGRRHRESGIPCDVLWLDIDHMDGYRVFTWDPVRFPDPPGMLERMAQDGLRVITIVDPGVKAEPGYCVFDDAVARDVLCRTEQGGTYLGQVWPGLTAFPDFATPQARAWWGELNAAHVRTGVAGIWNDMNEPATGAVDPLPMRFDRGRASHERFHNQYALLMAMGTVAGLREAMPDLRTFVLSRAGFAGIQRYAANWMGDNMARWDHLALSIPMGNGLGLSGQPFVGADIGGFMGDCHGELLVRWTQLGALTPFCRNHSAAGSIDQYAWAFGPQVEAAVRDAIQLRYRLLPTLYAAFVHASETGVPVQRPLLLDHQDAADLAEVEDQFLLGEHLMVSPVVAPGATRRTVRFPAGGWYDGHTGRLVVDGSSPGTTGRWVDAPLQRIPLHVRAGSVVAMWPEAPPSTSGYHPVVIELHVFVPVDDRVHHSLLQEDDGLTTAALSGARWRSDFTLRRDGSRVVLQCSVTGAGYPEFAREAFDLVIHGASPERVEHRGTHLPVIDGHVRLPNRGESFTVSFTA